MATVGKITTGNKIEGKGASDKGGFFIKTLTKKNAQSYKVTSEHDDELQLELIQYNAGKNEAIRKGMAKVLAEACDKDNEEEQEFLEKLEGFKKKLEGVDGDELVEKTKKLEGYIEKQRGILKANSEKRIAAISQKQLELYKDECSRAPIEMVNFDDAIVGRMVWDQKKNSTFCRNLSTISKYLAVGGYDDKAIRTSYANDGSKVDDIVECNPRECPHANASGDGEMACKPVAKLHVNLDLPSSPSGGSVFTLDTKSYNSRQNIIDFFTKANEVCGGFLAGIKMELFLRRKTMVDASNKTRNPKLIFLRFASTMEETLDRASKNIDMALKLQQIKAKFKDSVDLFKINEEDMAGDDECFEEDLPAELAETTPIKDTANKEQVNVEIEEDEIPF